MNILVTGTGSSGSWKIRGQQLGTAIGARVRPRADRKILKDADMVVAVKRLPPSFREAIKKLQRPWVWDLVDFYPQPACTEWGPSYARRWVRSAIKEVKPSAIIWPNQKMRDDCDVDIPGLILYHHYLPNIERNPIRKEIHTVGYEGSERYLGAWAKEARKACHSRGINFVVNTGCHADWDVCIAVRDKPHAGYVQTRWKSNVKLANAHGSGTPFIGNPENGYIETGTGDEVYVEDPSEIGSAIDALQDWELRKKISHRFLANAFSLDTAAKRYREFLLTHGAA